MEGERSYYPAAMDDRRLRYRAETVEEYLARGGQIIFCTRSQDVSVDRPNKARVPVAIKEKTLSGYRKLIHDAISKGTFTRAQIVADVLRLFPDVKESTIRTIISDSKNPRYNKFDRLVTEDGKGVLRFVL